MEILQDLGDRLQEAHAHLQEIVTSVEREELL